MAPRVAYKIVHWTIFPHERWWRWWESNPRPKHQQLTWIFNKLDNFCVPFIPKFSLNIGSDYDQITIKTKWTPKKIILL